MRHALSLCTILIAACGGKPKAQAPQDPTPVSVDEEVEPEEDPPIEEEPPPLRQWRASAALSPVAGIKLSDAAVRFTQIEGAGVDLTTDGFPGLKAGAYQLVIHEGVACGKNATKAGPIWEQASTIAIPVTVGKRDPGALEENGIELALDGDASIVGRTLVLHAVKKGAPGKAVACGPIVADETGGDDEQ